MIGYLTEWDGITIGSTFGQNTVGIARAVQPSRVRILGNSIFDLDGMYTYPAEQTYTASFVDRAGNTNARALFQRLGRAGWLKATTRAATTVRNWAKLVSIESDYAPNDWTGSETNKYRVTFACAPFWYDDADTTTTLTSATSVTLTNAGNARSQWIRFNITSSIASSLVIRIGRNSGVTYGIPKYGEAIYDGSDAAQQITYNSAKAADIMLTIDSRTNSVTLGGNDDYADIVLPINQADLAYLFPGSNTVTFSVAVTGTVVHRGAYV